MVYNAKYVTSRVGDSTSIVVVVVVLFAAASVATRRRFQAALLFIVISTVTLGFAVHLTWRSAASTLPRLSCARTSFFMATLFVLVAFWLFYIFRALVRPSIDFAGVLHYAATLLFLLIILHALWLSYAHRRRRNAFRISVVRDPDGERHDVLVDAKSIQEAAVDVLNAYHAKFDVFNAYAEHVRLKTFDAKWAPQLNFKIYHVEQNSGAALNETNIGKLIEVAGRQSGRVHNEHYAQVSSSSRRRHRRHTLRLACVVACRKWIESVALTSENIV